MEGLVGRELNTEMQSQIISFFMQNQDCIAWSHADMTEINPEIISYHLNVDLTFKPVRQKWRKEHPVKSQM